MLTEGPFIRTSADLSLALEETKQLESKEFIRAMAEQLEAGLIAADSIGRSYVVDKDVFYSQERSVLPARVQTRKYLTRADGVTWIAAAGKDRVNISFDLTPTNALQFFRSKAFWISGIENQRFIDAVKSELQRAFTDGITYQDFADRFEALYRTMGITPDKPVRLDMIFRTNLFSAYTAGQVQQVSTVKDRFPVWRYVAIMDDRTRHSHRELNNRLFRYGPFPPISFNCRCTPQFIHQHQLERMGSPEVLNTITDVIDAAEVVDFLSPGAYEQWIADNPLQPGISDIITGS